MLNVVEVRFKGLLRVECSPFCWKRETTSDMSSVEGGETCRALVVEEEFVRSPLNSQKSILQGKS